MAETEQDTVPGTSQGSESSNVGCRPRVVVFLPVTTAKHFCLQLADGPHLGFTGVFLRGIGLGCRLQSITKQRTQHPTMKATLSFSIALLTFLGINKAAPTDANTPQVSIAAKFIEVGDSAKDLLEPFGAASGSPTVAGLLSDEQLRALWKELEITKGMDVLYTPGVTVRSGRKAKIEIAREFAYKDADGRPAKKQLGTMLSVLATKLEGNDFDLEVSPEIVELDGTIKLSSGEEQPKFKARKATWRTTMASGQTIVLGFPVTSTKQTTEDRSAGRITAKTETVTRHTLVFVTARLVDSASGKPVDSEIRN